MTLYSRFLLSLIVLVMYTSCILLYADCNYTYDMDYKEKKWEVIWQCNSDVVEKRPLEIDILMRLEVLEERVILLEERIKNDSSNTWNDNKN